MQTTGLAPASRVFKTRQGAANAAARLAGSGDLAEWVPSYREPEFEERVTFEVGLALYPVKGFVALARTEQRARVDQMAAR